MLNTDYFTLFGLKQAYQQDLAKVKQCYLSLQQHAHPDNYMNGSSVEKQLAIDYAAWINEGFKTLSDPLKRAIYLLKLQGIDVTCETQTNLPVDFLMEQMALREALAEIAGDLQQEALSRMQQKIDNACRLLETQFSDCVDLPTPNLTEAKLCVQKLQFYHRIQEEMAQLQHRMVSRSWQY